MDMTQKRINKNRNLLIRKKQRCRVLKIQSYLLEITFSILLAIFNACERFFSSFQEDQSG